LVSFSVKSSGGAPSATSQRRPYSDTSTPMIRALSRSAPRHSFASTGCRPQRQVLRHQIVGRRSSGAACGPRFQAVIRTRISSHEAFAYSTNTSK